MKMKMNKNKTMLALVLVAALALCSVAVIADAQQSDADDVTYSYLTAGNYTVQSTDSNIFIYGGAATITVPATVTYSGTISFGYYNPNAGFSVATDSITLSGASDLTVSYGSHIKVSGNYAGDVTLSAGSVEVGTTYNGSINAGDAKFTNEDSYGLIVTLKDGKACMSGTIAAGKVTVTGTAFIDATSATVGMTVGTGAELVIANDAKVDTMPWSTSTYEVKFSADKVITAPASVSISGATTTVSGKNVVASGLNVGTHDFSIDGVTGKLVILEDGKCYVNSTYSVEEHSNVTATYDATAGEYTVKVKTNACNDGLITAATITDSTPTTYSMDSKLNGVITFKIPEGDFSTAVKTIVYDLEVTFSGSVIKGELKVVATVADDGTYSDGKSTLKISQSVSDQTKNAKLTTAYNRTSTTIVDSTIEGTLTVDGTLNVNKVYVAATTTPAAPAYFKYAGLVTGASDGKIYSNGMIKYQNEGSISAALTEICLTEANDMNATMYYVENTSVSPTNIVKFTYYFTTISNALSNSAEITVYGKQVIENDMTLENGVTGEDNTDITIIGELSIGVKADSEATPAVEGKTAIVTVPTDTTTINYDGVTSSSAPYYGGAVVQNGQLRFTDLGTDSENDVIADVFIADAEYGIYTDLATALDMAVSGDVVMIRDNAAAKVVLSKNTEVKDGVDLIGATGKIIYVPCGIVFTISGAVDVDGILVLDYTSEQINDTTFLAYPALQPTTIKYKGNPGVLNLNTYDVTAGYIGLYAGKLNFTSSFDNTDDSFPVTDIAVLGTKKFNAIVNVEGKYTMEVPFTNMASTTAANCNLLISVPGQLTADSDFDSDRVNVYTILNVTGTVDVVDKTFNVSELNAAGSAKILAAEGSYLGIFVEGFIGEESKSPKENTNAVEASVATLVTSTGKNAVLTVYGTATKVEVYDATGADDNEVFTEFFVDESVLYETVYYAGTAGADDMVLPELKFDEYKNITVWYADPGCETAPVSDVQYGEYEKLYGKLVVKTYSVTFEPQQHTQWLYNSQYVSGPTDITNKSTGNTLKVEAVGDYEIKDLAIFVNGNPIPSNYVPTEGDNITFTGDVVKKDANSGNGMDLITILLIIITIVIIIMAIIIALKLLRS